MHLAIQACILGILTGGVYALMASGLTLAFGVMKVINVAQGAMIILGAYISYSLFTRLHIDPFVSIVVMTPAMFLLGVGLQLALPAAAALRRERGALAAGHVGDRARHRGSPEPDLPDDLSLDEPQLRERLARRSSGFRVSVVRVLGFAVSAVILLGLFLMLSRTRLGRSIRATVQNPTSARLLGIEATRVSAIGFGISVATATAAGAVYGIVFPFNPGSHYDLISRTAVDHRPRRPRQPGRRGRRRAVHGRGGVSVRDGDLPDVGVVHVLHHADRRPAGASSGPVRHRRARFAVRRVTAPGASRAAIIFGALLAFPFLVTTHWVVNAALFALMYAAIATSWNLLGGYTGYLSLGHAAFFGIGAYAIGIWFTHASIGAGYKPFFVLPVVGRGGRGRVGADRLGRRCACARRRSRSSPSRCCSWSSSWRSTCTA